MSAVSSGAQPSNSSATQAKAVAGSEKSMPSIQSLGLFRLHVRVQHALGLAVREDAFTRRKRHHRATANRFRARLVTGVAVKQVRLDE